MKHQQHKKTYLVVGLILLSTPLIAPTISETAPNPQDKQAQNYPWQNEEAYYKVKINGSDAVHALLRVGAVGKAKGKFYVPVSAKAQSTGLFKSVMEINDLANTFINPMTHQPYRAEKRFKERVLTQGLKERTYRVDYAHDKFQATIKKTSNLHKEKKYIKSLPKETHDGISWIFHLRSRKSFKPKDTYSYYIYDGWKLSRLDLVVEKKEKVHTGIGWKQTWKINVKREILNTKTQRNKKGHLAPLISVRTPAKPVGSIWITDDAQRLPVKLGLTWKISKTTNMIAQVDVVIDKYKRSKKTKKSNKPVKQN